MSVELTVGQFLWGILPRLSTENSFPEWPPDCFALCLAVLKKTGAYTKLFLDWPPARASGGTLQLWTRDTRELGRKWRTNWSTKNGFSGLEDEWGLLCRSFSEPLYSINGNRSLCLALMKLVAVADEASEGVGAPKGYGSDTDDAFFESASVLLETANTLCAEVNCTRLRVLPRMHTPQSGVTERSLSLYLSLVDSSEVIPTWLSTPFIQRESFNLLIIPCPFEVLPKQFRNVTELSPDQLPENFGFFTFDSNGDEQIVAQVSECFQQAERMVGKIDGIVLPEMAITETQFRELSAQSLTECFLVCGVGAGATDDQRGSNFVKMSFPPLQETVQKKHHPWKLTESQVIQYGLGGVLSPSREWWEYSNVADRKLIFMSMSADLVLSVLICEDLARPDPVADLVRAVGPNLVIALLMDGPQTAERWGARYATVLADDPGCSVLTLTNLGMAKLSRPRTGTTRSDVIAIWKDAFGGATEIVLPSGSNGVVLSLSTRYREEFTADGRGDDASAAFPILTGIHPVRSSKNQKR